MSVKRLLFRLLVIVRRFVVSLGLGVTILAVLLTVGYIFSGGWVASRLSQIVNQRLFIDRSTRLVVARVTGSLFTRVVFDGVELDRRIGDTWSPSVRADRVVEVLIHDPKRVELRADGQWFIWQGQTALEFAELADSLGIGGE